MMSKATKPDKTRQLSIEQANAIEHLLQGQSDRAVAEAVGVSRQTISEWKNHDPLFVAELNRQRSEMWKEARERMKALANRALDVVELQFDSDDPKAALAAAKYILQGTLLLGDTDLPRSGPTSPEAVIMAKLRSEARMELEAEGKDKGRYPFKADLFRIEDEIEALANSRLKKAMAEAGLS
jgi:transcriptional regulator with XRE-family HTH domain